MTDIDKLIEGLDFTSELGLMTPVKCGIKGRAFFPGGKGITDESGILRNKDIMILGQDFDTKANYERSCEKEMEDNPTWRNLIPFLEDVNIEQSNCFFTNAIMGVRNDNKKNTGKSPAFKDRTYIEECRKFFLFQLEVQQPKVILVLGLRTAEFLYSTSPRLQSWKTISNFNAVDSNDGPVIRDVVFNNNIKAHLVLLMHPSARQVNLKTRKFHDVVGKEAQIKMVQEVLHCLI